MPNEKKTPEEKKPSYTPASPEKRALAWMGIVYMVILVLLFTYNLADGEPLHGGPGILLAPGCGGLSAVAFLRYRAKGGWFHLALGVVAALLCLVTAVVGVITVGIALGLVGGV